MPTTSIESTLIAGDTVTIYEDPLTEIKSEGTARLICKHRNRGGWDGRRVETWVVIFDDGSAEETHRLILAPFERMEAS